MMPRGQDGNKTTNVGKKRVRKKGGIQKNQSKTTTKNGIKRK